MGQLKPWQIVLIVVALAVLGGSVAWTVFGGKKVDLADSMMLVDVTNGDLYRLDITGTRGIMIPGRNPETNEETLLPVYKNDAGQWTLMRRYSGELGRITGESSVVDAATLEVKISDAKPRDLKRH